MQDRRAMSVATEPSDTAADPLTVTGSPATIRLDEPELVILKERDLQVVRLPHAPAKRRHRSLRIAMIGQRGVPATFGGVEHHVEELGARLVERGHEVTVFTRKNYVEDTPDEYRGMKLRHLPTVGTKHLDAIVHSALSTLVAMRNRFDVIHYHAVGPGIPALMPRVASRAKIALTVHGLDGDRAKWGSGAQKVLKMAEWLSAKVPNATITVSQDLARHYAMKYSRSAWHVPNGVNPGRPRAAHEISERFGLRAGSYYLFVGRMVPEKAPDQLIKAFRDVPGDTKLVMAGDSSYTSDFVRSLRDEAGLDDRIVFPGYVYGDTLAELYSNAAAFVLPSLLEGLPLTLLEAISYGAPVITSDIPPHLEILKATGPGHRIFPCGNTEALTSALLQVRANRTHELVGAHAMRSDVLRRFGWDAAVEATEEIYDELVA